MIAHGNPAELAEWAYPGTSDAMTDNLALQAIADFHNAVIEAVFDGPAISLGATKHIPAALKHISARLAQPNPPKSAEQSQPSGSAVDAIETLRSIRAAADTGGATEGQCYSWWRELSAALRTPPPAQAAAKWLSEVRAYLEAAAHGSMSRNNSEQLASELIDSAPPSAQPAIPETYRDLIRELADDLEAEIDARKEGDLPSRIDRDLAPVRRARIFLSSGTATPPSAEQ